MSDIFIKTAASGQTGWRKASNIFVKTTASGQTGWRRAAAVFLKTASQWLRVWPLSGVFATRTAWIGPDSTTAFADRLTSDSRIRIGSNYYGNNAQWDANGWTISSYSYAWRYYSTNDGLSSGVTFPGESGTGSGWTAGGTGQDVLPLSTWDNSTNNTTYDRKYIRFEVTANATNSTYSGSSSSPYIQIIRRVPTFTGNPTLSTNTPRVGTAVTYTSPTWDTSEARKEESTRTTVVWYTNSANSTTGGTQVGTGTSYTPASADVGKYLYVIETRFNSGTDYDLGLTTGVSASVIATSTISEESFQITGSQRRITLPSNFTSGTTLYISTNGFVNWGGTDPGGTRSIPTSGITIAPLLADLRQGQSVGNGTNISTGGLWTYADDTNFYVRWEGNYYTDAAQLADYQIKFYWNQSYADVYFINNSLTTVTPSTIAVQNGANLFRSWSQSTSQTSTLINTSIMTRNSTNDGQDDTRTVVTASIPGPPTITGVTFTSPSTVNVSFTGGSGPYYQIFWNISGTAPANSATFYDAAGDSSPIEESITPTDETTYYFWIRSSTQNIPDTTSPGNATEGTFSNWSSRFDIKLFARPTNLTATTNDRTKIRLEWSGGAGPNYQAYWTTGTDFKPIDKSSTFDFSAGATSPFDWTRENPQSSMFRGISYRLFIRANNGTTYTNWFPTAAPGILGRAPLYAPGVPLSAAATAVSSSRIDLTWSAPSIPSPNPSGPDGASGYDIFYTTSSTASVDANTTPTTTATSPGTSTTPFQVTGLTANTDYYFWIRATNADNTGANAGPWTARFTAKTQQALTTPTSLTATDSTRNDIRLTWSGGSGDAYAFYYTSNNSFRPDNTSNITDFAATSSPYDFTPPARGTKYYFFVKARNGTSPNFTYSTAWFPAAAPGEEGRAKLYAPGVPTSPSALTNGSSSITISWTAPAIGSGANLSGPDSASGYDIYYAVGATATAPTASTTPTTSTTSTSINITGLTAFTTYSFWVRATNDDNTGSSASSWTARFTAKTGPGTPTPTTAQLGSTVNTNVNIGATFAANTNSVTVEYGTSIAYGNSFTLSASGNSGKTVDYSAGTQVFYRMRAFNSTDSSFSDWVTGSYTTVNKVTRVTVSCSSTAPFAIWSVEAHGMRSMRTSVFKSTVVNGSQYGTGANDPILSANTTTGAQTRQTSVTPGGVGYNYFLRIDSAWTANNGTGTSFNLNTNTNIFNHQTSVQNFVVYTG